MQVLLVMVKFKEVIGVTRAKVTVRLVVVAGGVARTVEKEVLEEDQSALAVAGITGQTALTNGVTGVNQTAKSAQASGLEEGQNALAAAGTMVQPVLTSGAMEANQTAISALVHGLEAGVNPHHQLLDPPQEIHPLSPLVEPEVN